ncbi:DUF3800 domain-containing protein [Larkinella rosea]|nr:DUF3800 domain-containing protein [Larkinella rosea]
MDYYLFLDESGDHGLTKINPDFPVLVLCGILISGGNYRVLRARINELKIQIWGNKGIVFHSKEIRKRENDFSLFKDREVMMRFIEGFNSIVSECNYRIISTAIRKEAYKDRYHNPFTGVYQKALSFIIERTVFSLDERRMDVPQVKIVAESRGNSNDLDIMRHIEYLKIHGTGYVSAYRINNYGFNYAFLKKSFNINGLQFADMLAYPIARYVINSFDPSVNFDLMKKKFYQDNEGKMQGYGLKIFP